MKQDQAIEEIRDVRKAISTQFHDDVTVLSNHYRELEETYQTRMLPLKHEESRASERVKELRS